MAKVETGRERQRWKGEREALVAEAAQNRQYREQAPFQKKQIKVRSAGVVVLGRLHVMGGGWVVVGLILRGSVRVRTSVCCQQECVLPGCTGDHASVSQGRTEGGSLPLPSSALRPRGCDNETSGL